MNDTDQKISIIIITYNRPDDMLELALNLSQLERMDLLDEIVIVNNHSSLSYKRAENFIDEHPHIPFRYYVAEENLGVSRGRNYAAQKSKSSILVFLDDDALFQNKDAILQIKNIFSEKSENSRPTGIVSFKVFYYSTMEMQQTAFPHKKFEERKDLHHFETPYFVGCAHAIKKTVFETVGYYPENFFYGMEEYDLSYRTLNAGFSIVYDDGVVILHKESSSGRLPNKEKLRGMWINKSKVAWKYLPKKYFYSTALLWSYEYLRKTKFNLHGWIKGWREVFTISYKEKRTPLSKECLAYLKKIQARLRY